MRRAQEVWAISRGMTMTKKLSKIFFVFWAIFAASIVFSAEAWDTSIYVTGPAPLCSVRHTSLRGNWQCIKKIDDQSCINTTPVSSTKPRGVSSPMCRRGEFWCSNNWNKNHKCYTSRCKFVGNNCVAKDGDNGAKNHEGYDYSANCNDPYYAPCDGEITLSKVNGVKFECDKICGKTYEYTFYHNPDAKPTGRYRKGEVIAWVGDVGKGITECHAHIEIRGPGPNGNKTLLDPMAPGFNAAVCSCDSTAQTMDRSQCFKGGDPGGTYQDFVPTCDGGECPPTGGFAGAGGSGSGGGSGQSVSDPDCIYDNVIMSYSNWGCLFCKPFKIIFNTMSNMAQHAYDIFAKYVVLAVAVGFAIWLAIIVLKTVSTFNKAEPRILIKTMLGQAFRVLFVVLLLQGPLQQILDFTVNPVFETGLRLAELSSGYVGLEGAASCNLGEDAVAEGGAVSSAFGNGVLCTVKKVQEQIMKIVAIGRVCHCLAWENTTWALIPNFAYLLSAFIFMIAGFLLMVIYPFLLIDSLLKLTIVIALLPLALGAFAFKMNYLKKIWETFLNAMFTFIFLSIIISIIAHIADKYAGEILTSEVLSYRIASVLWFTSGGIKLAFVCLLGWVVLGEMKPFASKFGGGINLDIGAQVGGNVADLTKKTVGTPVKKAAVKTAGKVADVAYKNVSQIKRYANAARFESIGEKARDEQGNLMLDEQGNQMYVDKSITPGNIFRRAVKGQQTFRSYGRDENGNIMEIKTTSTKASKNVVQKNVSRAKERGKLALDENGNQMYDEQGNKMYVDRSLTPKNLFRRLVKGQQTFRSYARDENGNIIKNETIITGDSKTVQKKDAFGKVETKDGALVDTQLNNRKFFLRGGKIDRQEMDNFMQNSLLSDEEKQIALVKQLIDERMGDYAGGRLGNAYKRRRVSSQKDESGNDVIKVEQINSDGTLSTFEAKINGNDRVMTTVKTQDAKGNAREYATDGIIQRKSITENGSTLHKYAVSSDYNSTERPVFMDGSVASTIDPNNIMFSRDDMQRFGEQVHMVGNRKYTFSEFL